MEKWRYRRGEAGDEGWVGVTAARLKRASPPRVITASKLVDAITCVDAAT